MLDEIWKRDAQRAMGGTQVKGTVVLTAYNPKTHSAKGMLVPEMVETGWCPLASMHAGDGYGVLVGPNVGSAEELDGDVMDVEFENGDPNTPIFKHKHFSMADNPPEVQPGEILIKHQTGGSTLHKADGSIITTHKDGGVSMFDADGHHTLDTKNRNVTVNSGSGSQTFSAKSQTFTADNISLKGAVSVDGDISQSGSLASNDVTVGGRPVRTA